MQNYVGNNNLATEKQCHYCRFNPLDASMKHVYMYIYLVLGLEVLTLHFQNPLLIITHCWPVTKSERKREREREREKKRQK